MKASEFIKKYGWGEAKKRLQFYDKTYPNVSRLQQELKPYVDAYDLVESYGGIHSATKHLKSEYRRISTPETYLVLDQSLSLVEEYL